MARITSVKKVPFTPEEQRALKMMLDLSYHQRATAKAEFCETHKRNPEEVTQYLKGQAQSRRWARTRSETDSTESTSVRRGRKTRLEDTSGSMIAPQEQGADIFKVGRRVKNELRITFKSIRVEGTTMIFEV